MEQGFLGHKVEVPSGVINDGRLGNPRTEWRFIARKTTLDSVFSVAMFDHQRVPTICKANFVGLCKGISTLNT